MKTVLLCFIIVCAFIALTQAECEFPCPFIYSPICAGPPGQARGIQSFDNDCMLTTYNCKEKNKLDQIR
uniref:Putative secreted protein n=1 Tax=Nyssomyia neivai TaxID=330878 RepID=A0A1L8DPB6_9DIPT